VSAVELRVIVLVGALVVVGTLRFVKFRRQLARLEAHIRHLREIVLRELKYTRVEASDPKYAAQLAELGTLDAELAAAQLTVLGDAVGSNDPQPTRWYRDAEGTVYGWCAVLHKMGQPLRVAVMLSRAGDEIFSTRRTVGQVALAQPPFSKRAIVPLTTTMTEVVAHHRKLAALDATTAARFDHMMTLEDATRQFERQRAQIVAWRDTQSPGELLDKDLREILGKHYAVLAPKLARRFDVELPTARVV
jgi:hypothetical protein